MENVSYKSLVFFKGISEFLLLYKGKLVFFFNGIWLLRIGKIFLKLINNLGKKIFWVKGNGVRVICVYFVGLGF